MWPLAWLVALLLWCGGGSIAAGAGAGEWSPATLATLRGHAALQAEGLARCEGLTRAWLALADKETGLLPRNTKERAWVVKDSASDNYPYLVVSAYLTDRVLFGSTMLDILHAEAKYTSRVGRVRDDYSFEKHTWVREKLDMSKAVFGTAEYIKDGLLPLTDYLGPSPWSDEMLGMMDDLWAYANVKWPYGVIPSSDIEVHGDLLQALARLYWFTGNPKYIEPGCSCGTTAARYWRVWWNSMSRCSTLTPQSTKRTASRSTTCWTASSRWAATSMGCFTTSSTRKRARRQAVRNGNSPANSATLGGTRTMHTTLCTFSTTLPRIATRFASCCQTCRTTPATTGSRQTTHRTDTQTPLRARSRFTTGSP
eukprot:TRINITY_DN846_c0_g1_i6.p1 TRINITY_DN846_c0_g1~~TRINITY_DN846_c0_g1_i6.p1  ORF type:complete len:368 (-),score=31.61 TRINITY_DN846_c0_g1_i6:236-1339(-)